MNQFTGIPQAIIKSLQEKGIGTPTEIQAAVIPLLQEHDGDFAGRAATGTGKTIAFAIPLITKIKAAGKIQAVVLVPTRELCRQVAAEITDLSANLEHVNVQAIYGGISVKEQTRKLSSGVNVLVATPGRLLDLITRKVIYLTDVDTIVLDEADEMLSKGFMQDLQKILNSPKKTYATWLFSATMPDEIKGFINQFLRSNIKKVLLGSSLNANEGITHQSLQLSPIQKLDVLLLHINNAGDQKIIIFCRTKSGVQKLYKQLAAKKIKSGALHGDLPQGIRDRVIEQFKNNQISILVATDVASRGMDIERVELVIQYHMPDTPEAYIHRSGRTSRAGHSGTSITFLFEEELEKWELILEELSMDITPISPPDYDKQSTSGAILWAKRIAKTKPYQNDENTLKAFKQGLNHLSKDELISKLLGYYKENEKNIK